MNNKLFKIGLGVASLGAVVAPLATVISCGNSVGRYEAEDDKKLVLLTQYDNQGYNTKAWDALNKQVTAYNRTTPRNGYKIRLLHVENGNVSGTLTSTYQAQDKNKIANMAIAYPDTLGVVAKYDQQLDLSKTNPTVDLSSVFNSSFTDINNNIGGLDAGTYLAPVAKSTEFLGVNKPLMGYLLNELGTSSTNNTKVNSYITLWNTLSTTPSGDFTANQKADIENFYPKKVGYSATNKIDDSIFTDASKMLDFAIEVAKAFDINDNSDSAKKSFVFGIDSATNFIYNYINSKFNGDKSKFLFKKDAKSGYIKYQFNDTDVKTAFTDIWNKLKEGIDAGALFFKGQVNGKNEYGSTYFVPNRLAASIGSTAGYNYSVKTVPTSGNATDIAKAKDKANPSEFESFAPFHKWENETGNGSALVQGPSLIALHVNESEDNETAKFVNWFITKPASGDSPLATFTKEAGYVTPTTAVLGAANPYTGPRDTGNKIAFDQLKEISQGNLNGFDNPVDDTTGQTRKSIQDAIYQQYTQKGANTSNKAVDIDGLYKLIKKGFSGKFE